MKESYIFLSLPIVLFERTSGCDLCSYYIPQPEEIPLLKEDASLLYLIT